MCEMVKMTSFDAAPSPQKMAESVEAPESSDFIIFANPPSPVSNIGSSFLMNVVGATPDLSPEEVHQWLKELLRENIDLKEALQKNNMRMEEQLSTVSAWREQMFQTNNNMKINFEEGQKFSKKLKEENACLRQRVQTLECKIKASEDYHIIENAGLKEELIELQKKFGSLQQVENNLRSELKKEQAFQQQFEMSMHGISVELSHLQSSSKLLEEEKHVLTALNNQLQSELSRLKVEEDSKIDSGEPTIFNDEETGYAIVMNPDKTRKDQKVKGPGLKEILLSLKEEQFKVSSLTQELAEEKVQVSCLRKLVEERNEEKPSQDKETQASITSIEKSEVSTQIPELENGAQQVLADEDLRKELALTKEKLSLVTSYLQNYKDRCDNLQSQNEKFIDSLEKQKVTDKAVIELLQQDMKALRNTLHHERALHYNERTTFVEARYALEQLSKEYKKVTSELESLKAEQDEDCRLQEQSRDAKHLDQLDSLTAKLMNSEEQLEEQKRIVQSLNQKIANFQRDFESIPILKAQIEVHKADYESEKMARETLATNLKDLEEITKNLQEELLTPNKTSSSPGSSKMMKNKSRSSLGKHPDVQVTELSCPRCTLVFDKLDALQNHVELCLEDDYFM